MAVQAFSAGRLCGTKMQKLVEECFTLIHYDLRKGLSSTLERGRPQFIRTVWNNRKSPVCNFRSPSSNLAQKSCRDFHREALFSCKELPIGSAFGNGGIIGRLQLHFGTRHSQGTTIVQETSMLHKAQNGPPNVNNGEKKTVRTASGRELKGHILQGRRGGGNLQMPNASTTREVVAILKSCEQEGIIVNSYTFMEVLKLCLEQKDLIAAREVHECIIRGGMDKNPYVATSLLNVYIRCGRLQDARIVFDGLEKKTFVTWRSMIAGYAKNDHPEDALEVFNRMGRADWRNEM